MIICHFLCRILFPGGGTYFNETGGYGEAAKQLYDLATKANERGVYYPLWGICLGMQVLIYGALGFDIRGDCSAKNISLPLEFVDGKPPNKMPNDKKCEIICFRF